MPTDKSKLEEAKDELRKELGLLGKHVFILKRMFTLVQKIGTAQTFTDAEAKELLTRQTGCTTDILLTALCHAQLFDSNVVIVPVNTYMRRTVMEKLCEFINMLNDKSPTLLWSTRSENQVRNEATGRLIVVLSDIDDHKVRGLSPLVVLHDT